MFSYSLSALETIVADFGDDLSPKTATVAKNSDSRRIRQQSPFSATVAEFDDYIVASVDRALDWSWYNSLREPGRSLNF